MHRRQFILNTSALCLTALTGACTTSSPANTFTDWPTASPASAGLDPALLEKLVQQIRHGEHSNVHSLLVIRRSRLILEEYFSGPDERRDPVVGSRPVGTVTFDRDTLHDMRSVTKSVVSILFGIAQSQRLITSLDQPVLDFFPEYPDLLTPERQAIRLRDLLSMTPGWEWDEDSKPYGDPGNSETAMDNSPDPFRYALSRPIIAAPGKKWQYNGGTTLLLGTIIERVTRQPLNQFAEKFLFGPIGIKQYDWVRYPNGKVIPASGLRLRPRDLARIARLYLQNGHWNNQVVPESWVKLSTSPQAPGGSYGFHWWTGGTGGQFGPSGPWAMALGYGGQRALLCPSLDLIVVTTAGLYNNRQQSPIIHQVLRQCVEAVNPQK